ncbi:MAG TPA: hypothetical protein DIT67_09820 [Octadecabacter sp.]|nr:hypothetical protein [Octadecabacter sp.]
MRSYEAARSLFSFLAFIAWSVVVVGVLVALVSAVGASKYGGGGAGLLAMVPGIGIGITGFILIAFVQMGRATVDTAEYTQQMLKTARDQLEVSKQGLKLQNAAPQTFAAVVQKESAQEPKSSFANQADKTSPQGRMVGNLEPEQLADQSTIYKGKTIRNEKGKFLYKGIQFDTLLSAKEHVDSLAAPPARKLPVAPKET